MAAKAASAVHSVLEVGVSYKEAFKSSSWITDSDTVSVVPVNRPGLGYGYA